MSTYDCVLRQGRAVSKPEKQFWKTLTGAVLGLAGLAGLYLTASSVDATWAFWFVIVLSFTYATVVVLLPRAYKRSVEYSNRVSNYPKLLQLKAKAETDKDELLATIDELRTKEKDAYHRGVSDGIGHAWGAIASRATEVPVLTHAMKELGGLVLVARCEGSPPPVGARYQVVGNISSVAKGVVEVRREGHSARSVQLLCVSATDEGFWLRIAEKADLEDDLPRNIRLTPYELTKGEHDYLHHLADEETIG